MDTGVFPACRHAGAETPLGVRRCHSPRLAGLRVVTPEFCGGCAYRADDAPSLNGAAAPPLLPCAHLGAAMGANTVACSHPDHGVTTEEACRSCHDYLFPVLTPRTPPADAARLLALLPRRHADGWWDWPNVRAAQRLLADAFLERLPSYPGGFAGRGVVIAGGGRYFASAYITVRVLRHVGCTLPVQLWHLAGEVDEPMREVLAPYGVACVDAAAVARRRPFRFLDGHWWAGWQLKSYAILQSSFREVLYLDADSYPTRDPSFLFDLPRYRDWGAILWPDVLSGEDMEPDLWDVFGADPETGPLTESGQMVVHKELCWRELNLAAHLNGQADFVYRLTHGDKDTFTLAWRRLGRRWLRLWPDVHFLHPALLQYDGAGRVLFQHRIVAKFTLGGETFPSTPQDDPTERSPFLEHEDFCFAALDDLKKTWRGGGSPPHLRHSG